MKERSRFKSSPHFLPQIPRVPIAPPAAIMASSRPFLRPDRQIPAPRKQSVRTRPFPSAKRSLSAAAVNRSVEDDDSDSCRVRVAVRLRPKISEDLAYESDFADCVELNPELKSLKLWKNSWSSESYRFDAVFTESSSQRRVYEVVAKPVVESVLNGYNGTVMAYGRTGTGKTYTVGQLGKADPSERGIMVRAVEDIIADTSPRFDTITVSYLQLYLESLQDLLVPEKTNIPIIEDPKTGEVSLPGASIFEIRDLDQFLELLQIGETNRHAANTKLNTESSRSHAILMVYIKRSSGYKEDTDISSLAKITNSDYSSHHVPVLKSKLLIVDLAGSERIDKSGSEGHMLEEAKFINLSLTSLGKCINALAENSSHIPTRDSKLTRLLCDSFGGTARTSLVVTIQSSSRHYSETASTVMFGQRAMKVVNMVKLKEEFDYESLCRKLESQVDYLTSELERQQKLRNTEKEQMEKLKQRESSLVEVENILAEKSEKALADTTNMYENKMAELIKQLEEECSRSATLEEQLNEMRKHLSDDKKSLLLQQKIGDELNSKLQAMFNLNEEAARCIHSLEAQKKEFLSMKEKLLNEERQRKCLEDEIVNLRKLVSDNSVDPEAKKLCNTGNLIRSTSGPLDPMTFPKSSKSRETSAHRTTISRVLEGVDLSNILALLRSEDLDVQIHAAKVVANLAAEDLNQEKIIEEGGLDAVLMLLESSENATILRVTAAAIANLAKNGSNQQLIMDKGGARLLANIASRTNDPQTLKMVAGALANLCGNESLHFMLKEDGGTRALLGLISSGHIDVIAQVARGIANFAKCESQGVIQGHRKGLSLLIEDGALSWMLANSTTFPISIGRRIELALCLLAQNEYNAFDIISSGGIKELVRISRDSSAEDIRTLAKNALSSNPAFVAEVQRT